MSKAYWIVRVSVRDEQRYPEYLAAAGPAFQKFGANFIVRGGAFETMEGSARERNVVVEFKDRATAFACYRARNIRARGPFARSMRTLILSSLKAAPPEATAPPFKGISQC